jgi:ribosomal protein S18 acetylase RimI-like enzyme
MRVYTSDGTQGPAPELRAATRADAEDIARVWHDGWADGHLGHVPEALVAHRLLDGFRASVPQRIPRTTVAVLDGRIVGFVTTHDDEVEQVYVAREARASGIADALLTHAEGVVASRYGLAWLAVVAGNARARRFYERNGWHDAGGIEYAAEIQDGTLPVPCRRYEKRVGREGKP